MSACGPAMVERRVAGGVGRGRAGATVCREHLGSRSWPGLPSRVYYLSYCSLLVSGLIPKAEPQGWQAQDRGDGSQVPVVGKALWSHQHEALASAAAVMSVVDASPTVPVPQRPKGKQDKLRGSQRTVLDPGWCLEGTPPRFWRP